MRSTPTRLKPWLSRVTNLSAAWRQGVGVRWARLSLGKKGLIVITIPLGALLGATLLTYLVNRHHTHALLWVNHTHEVRAEVQEIFTYVTEASTGVRGYLLTRQDDFLDPYLAASSALPETLAQVSRLVQDSPEQTARAQRISTLVRRQLTTLELLRRGPPAVSAAALEETLRANKLELDRLREVLREMLRYEEQLLAQRSARLAEVQGWQCSAALLNLLLGLGGGALAMVLFIRGIVRRAEHVETNARRLARGEPLSAPVLGGDVLSRLSAELAVSAAHLAAQTQRLRDSEARLRHVVANAPVMLHAFDAEGVFVFSEGRGLAALGKKPGELVGTSVFEAYRDLPQVLAHSRTALHGKSLTATVDIGALTFETRYLPTFDAGQVSGVVVVATDVTERKQAETVLLRYQHTLQGRNDELLRLSRLRDEFVAKISHELRTPLTAVIGFSELLLGDECSCPEGARQQSYAATILEASHHLLALINDLLDLSKIEAGMMELRPGPVDLSAAVANALTIIGGQARSKELRLDTKLPDDLPPLSADERRVRQILYNLLSNAVKYTPTAGYIQLAVYDAPDEVRVEVRDTGPGIPEAEQARLFQPFSQLRDPETDAFEGTGLGLALTKQLVELHGGRVWLHSRVGQGSTFGFSLPRDAEPYQDSRA